MRIKTPIIVLLFIFLLSGCDKNNANENEDSDTSSSKPSISSLESQSKKILDDAINSLNNVDKEFLWRDTHLILQESQKAIDEGNLELSIKLSQKVIEQTKLMKEQKDFAEDHWQDLIPKVTI